MTFPFQPNRSSSDEEMLDQHLNEWVSGFDANQHGDNDADPIAFHRWADDTRRTDPAATGPAAGTWNRVLRSFAQESPKGREVMSTTTFSADRDVAIGYNSRPFNRKEFHLGRFVNIAATVAIVIAVSIGGWLTMSQMPGSDGDGRFAAMQGTPQSASATCDVEPMTVDEVMEIVENPYKYAKPTDYGRPNSSPAPWYEDFAEVQPMRTDELSPTLGSVPTQSAMNEALPVLDSYLACLEHGTVGQSLRFVDPFSIQERVTLQFPFYREPDEVREFVTEWIAETPGPIVWQDDESGETLTFTPNRNIAEARTQILWLGLGFNQILLLGSNVLNEEGDLLARHDGTMQLVDGEKQSRFVMYTLVYSMYTEQWYVVTSWWPLEPRI